MMLDNLLRDIQANTQTWIGLVPVAINAIEALEDLLLRRFGDADAEILDADGQRIGRVRDADDDPLSLRRVLHRIRDEVDQYLTQTLSVADDCTLYSALDADLVL